MQFVEGFAVIAVAALAILAVVLFKAKDALAKAQEDAAVATSVKKVFEENAKDAAAAMKRAQDEAKAATLISEKARDEATQALLKSNAATLSANAAAEELKKENASKLAAEARTQNAENDEQECRALLNKPSRLDVVHDALDEAARILLILKTSIHSIDQACISVKPPETKIDLNTGITTVQSFTLEEERLSKYCIANSSIKTIPDIILDKDIVKTLKGQADFQYQKHTEIFNICENYVLNLTALLTYLKDFRSEMANNTSMTLSSLNSFNTKRGEYFEKLISYGKLIETMARLQENTIVFR
jgi:hypothetical protein